MNQASDAAARYGIRGCSLVIHLLQRSKTVVHSCKTGLLVAERHAAWRGLNQLGLPAKASLYIQMVCMNECTCTTPRAAVKCVPQATFPGCGGSIEASERQEADQQSIYSQVSPPVNHMTCRVLLRACVQAMLFACIWLPQG